MCFFATIFYGDFMVIVVLALIFYGDFMFLFFFALIFYGDSTNVKCDVLKHIHKHLNH
jgi:hypothetical protein